MKIAIVCSSQTGNTRVIAHALSDAFLAPLFSVQDSFNWQDFEILLLGFWCDKGKAPQDLEAFAAQIHGKTLGFFATLGGNPHSLRAKEWFSLVCDALLKKGKNNQLLGHFLCQGRIAPEIYEVLKQMAENTEELEKRFQSSQTHPDRMDMFNAVKTFQNAFLHNQQG